MELRDGMFAVKLCELEHQYGLLRSRLELCQGADHEKIRHLLAALAAMDQQMNCEEQQGKEHPV